MPFRALMLSAALLVFSLGPWLAGAGRAAKSENWRDDYRLPTAPVFPEDNPFTKAKAELGRSLFFDPKLSSTKTMSCASCHPPEQGWSSGMAAAREAKAPTMQVKVPSIIGVDTLDRLGWDGKFSDVEAVTFAPIVSSKGMAMSEEQVIARLSVDPDYKALFAVAFPGEPIDRRHVEMAVATYERSIPVEITPFDRWIAGDENAMSPEAKHGFALFTGKARCAECHSGWSFTDGSFHDIGVAKNDDLGRGRRFPSSLKLQHAFKTPTLRYAALHGPYMHDGSHATLKDVVAFYNTGGTDRPSRDPLIKPLGLSAQEQADLVAFLDALSKDLAAKK